MVIDQDEPKAEPKSKSRKQRGRPRKVSTAPQFEFPDLGVETPDFNPDQAFAFLGADVRKPTPPPKIEDDRPKVPMGYSPSRETDEDGTQDAQPWLNGNFG